MRYFRRSVLALRVLQWVLLASLAVFALASAFGFAHEREKALTHAHATARNVAEQSLYAISNALWQYDVAALDALLTGIVASRVVVRAEVLGPDKVVGEVRLPGFSGAVDRVWSLPIMAPDNRAAIGTLRISESYAEVHAEVAGTVKTLVLTDLVQIIALALVLFAITYAKIARPLHQLARDVTQLGHAEDAAKLLAARKPVGTARDEIDVLIEAINRFVAERAEEMRLRSAAEEERRLAQRALAQSEENLAITLHSIGDAVIATDESGRITRMNPTAERLTGWLLAEARGQPLDAVFRIVSAETRSPSVNPVQLVMQRGEIVSMANHTALLARDGRQYQIADSAAPIRNAANSIVGVVLVFSDVSEKYRAEESLRRRQLMMERTEAMARLASFEWDVDTNTVTWSPEMFRIFGRDPALGTPNLEGQAALYTPESTRALFDAVGKSLADGTPYEIELMTVQPNGEHRPCIAKGFPARDASGRVVRLAGLVQDVTERRLEEEKIRLAASVFAHAREGIVITDALGSIVEINEAFIRITGYSREDSIGRNPSILSSGRHDKSFFDALWQTLAVQGHWSGEIWNRRKNGDEFAELLTISAVRDGSGNIQHYVALFSDITGIKQHQTQLEHIAHFDALTHLPNRLLLADRLKQAMVQVQRRGQQVAVAYLDLDGFKNVNDRYGHDVGDQLLIRLATAMQDTLREGDTLARLGGDEFVAVLIDLDSLDSCLPLLTRLLDAAAAPVEVGGMVWQGSASIGVTFYPQAHDVEADQLMRQADQTMYQAKLAGKNRYHVFDAALDSDLRVHHESLQHIRQALAQGEFVLHYQPKVNMRKGQVIGAEALIRWQHPAQGLLPPANFLPVIEDHPLAVEVGEWVIDTALGQIETWHANGLDLTVSVNIGARQLQQGDFVQRLQGILARHPQVNPASLELEVLETSALADMAQVSQVIESCHQMGVRFALDDFGTGYSSLTYLKRLRVALLKIDQSFVRDMLDDPDDLAILEGVISLAAAFKREVIAEGVETVAHGTALLQLGCELAQGYGIARPMPGEQLPAWACTWKPDAVWSELPWLGGNPQLMNA
jgi:diguanylate cyclase (GGDEF)-like protein/PAS domain S-box-containing protein